MEDKKHIGFEINCVSHLLKREIDNAINEKGKEKLTGIQGFVISYISRNSDKDIFQRDIENEFKIRRSTATAILQLMEKNGLIKREPFEKDQRLKKIALTEKSVKRNQLVTEEIEKLENKLYSGLSNREIDDFFKIMDKIKTNIGG